MRRVRPAGGASAPHRPVWARNVPIARLANPNFHLTGRRSSRLWPPPSRCGWRPGTPRHSRRHLQPTQYRAQQPRQVGALRPAAGVALRPRGVDHSLVTVTPTDARAGASGHHALMRTPCSCGYTSCHGHQQAEGRTAHREHTPLGAALGAPRLRPGVTVHRSPFRQAGTPQPWSRHVP